MLKPSEKAKITKAINTPDSDPERIAGQRAMDALAEIHPAMYAEISGSIMDPSGNDGYLPVFLEAIEIGPNAYLAKVAERKRLDDEEGKKSAAASAVRQAMKAELRAQEVSDGNGE